MRRQPKQRPATRLVKEWPLPPLATLGSAVRARGILLEVRSRLPMATRKLLDIETGSLVLRAPDDDDCDYSDPVDSVTDTLIGIEGLPVIPRGGRGHSN